jgi:hypothetical protein
MKNVWTNVSLSFAAGSLGALANSIVLWIFGLVGINSAMGVSIAPALTVGFLYPRIVWGGLWGFLFLLPILPNSPVQRGLLFSLGPTLVQLLVVFPFKASKGLFGLELGLLTPLLVVFFNGVWGVVASNWYEHTKT